MAAPLSEDRSKISGLQDQVREVTEVMRDNVNRMLDRGERLDHLQMRSEELDLTATEFRWLNWRKFMEAFQFLFKSFDKY